MIQNSRPRFFPTNLRGGEGNMELMFDEGLTIVGQGCIKFLNVILYSSDGGKLEMAGGCTRFKSEPLWVAP